MSSTHTDSSKTSSEPDALDHFDFAVYNEPNRFPIPKEVIEHLETRDTVYLYGLMVDASTWTEDVIPHPMLFALPKGIEKKPDTAAVMRIAREQEPRLRHCFVGKLSVVNRQVVYTHIDAIEITPEMEWSEIADKAARRYAFQWKTY